MWAAILAMTILRCADAGWSTGHLQTLDVSNKRDSPGNLSGTIPNAVGSWSKMIKFRVSHQALLGSIPQALGSMSVHVFEVWHNSLRALIPDVVGSMTGLLVFGVGYNSLSGPIPHVVSSMTFLHSFSVMGNSLCGPLPDAVSSMVALDVFNAALNSLRGPIPHAFGSVSLRRLALSKNSLRGPIPHAVGSLTALRWLWVEMNSLCGPLPHVVGSMIALDDVKANGNSLRGPIPCAVGSLTELRLFILGDNGLRGPIPHAVGFMTRLELFHVEQNSLSGTIPADVMCQRQAHESIFCAYENQLSGSIPNVVMTIPKVLIHGNRLTGIVPALKHVETLTASGNLLEGTLSSIVNPWLRMLILSGVPARRGGLNGPLPPALRQASELKILAISNQRLKGGIPSFTSSLRLLALFKNNLNVLPDMSIENNASRTMILLHDNLLSCSVPVCGNASVKRSLIAIGNRLRYPKGEFPAWVLECEHDRLFWVDGIEGTSLLCKISYASGFFMFVVYRKLGSAKLLRAISGPWGTAHHHSCLVMSVCSRVVTRTFLSVQTPSGLL